MEGWLSNAGNWIQGWVLLILSISLVLQFCAAFFAVYMVRNSERRLAWMLIAAAFVLMGVRRAITFYGLFSSLSVTPGHLAAESVAFVISLMLLTGLLIIGPSIRGRSRLHSPPDRCNATDCGLFNNLPCGVAVFRAADARGRDFIIEDINPAVERIEQVARAHLINQPLHDVFPGVDDFGLPAVLHRVWKSGKPELFPMRHYEDDRISGWRDTAVYRRPDGRVVAVYNDVTAQIHMQQELERREHRFRLLYEQSPVPLLTLDDERRIININPAWAAYTGQSPDDTIGREFTERLSRESRRVFDGLQKKLQTGAAAEQGTLIFRENGRASFEATLRLLKTPGGIGTGDQFLVLVLPESEPSPAASPGIDLEAAAQKRAQQIIENKHRTLRLKKTDLLGLLTEGIAQELNAPLSAARDAVNLLRINMDPAARFTDFADSADRELRRMSELIERMYRLHEPVPVERERLNMNAMMDNALALLRKTVQKRGVRICDQRDPSVPKIEMPPGSVMAVLINLMRNAVEVLPADGTLTLRSGGRPAGGVWVEIEDDGPGIPSDFMPHLYEPFSSFHHQGADHRGIGLGMAIVQRTLDVLNGDITVNSRVGEGTVVRVEFPADGAQSTG